MSGSAATKTAASDVASTAATTGTDAATTAAVAAMEAQSNAGFLQNTEIGIQMNLQNQKNEVMESAIMGIAKAQL